MTTGTAVRRGAFIALAAAMLMSAAGCGSSSSSSPSASPDAAALLADAKAQADAASSFHVVMTSKDIPEDAAGMFGAEGSGTHAPAFQGTAKARFRGVSGDIGVVAVNSSVWLKLPFTPSYVKTDFRTLNLPDPAGLFSTDKGLTSFLTATAQPTIGDQTRAGSEVLTTVRGTLPGSLIVSTLAAGDPNDTYTATYGLTDSHQLRTVTLTGPFFPPASSTYEITLDRYGESVEIQEP